MEKEKEGVVPNIYFLCRCLSVTESVDGFYWACGRKLSFAAQGKGKKIFMTGTMGGAAMGAEGKFRRMVVDKGYVPVGSELFIMPGNYNNTVIPAEKNEKLIETA